MVQLAVLLPLTDYYDWCKTELPAIRKIKNGLDAFYNKDLKTVVRFLPALANELDGSEEQLKPNVMDSRYLHHPLLNLGRLAIRGDKQGKKLFLDSLNFTVKVAHHFNYEWPVMYNMETLEVLKAGTQPGKGGEKDVAGLYALVMLHAWQLTRENKYLLEKRKGRRKNCREKAFSFFTRQIIQLFRPTRCCGFIRKRKNSFILIWPIYVWPILCRIFSYGNVTMVTRKIIQLSSPCFRWATRRILPRMKNRKYSRQCIIFCYMQKMRKYYPRYHY